jgi:predicted RNA binding protein YcfA (HicA-like mRNA interferase family)
MADYRKLMKGITALAESNGWRVERTKTGHYKFISPDKSQPVIHLASTPSDPKTYICGIAQLRRHGLPVPR